MKKMIIPACAIFGLFTACDPAMDDIVTPSTEITAEQLANGFKYVQYSDEKCTTPAADGNYFKFETSPSRVVEIYQLDEEGNKTVLKNGVSSGVFKLAPKRGGSPTQTFYVTTLNWDGSYLTFDMTTNVFVPTELSLEVKLLASNDGQKVWKWNTSAPDGQVWGNMGSDGNHSGKDLALSGVNKWWGVTNNEEFLGQLNHTDDGQAHGDEDMDATMVFTEDGMIYCYDKGGNRIRSGKYQVNNYDPEYTQTSAYCGVLHTDAGSILFPYEINSGGRMPTDFQIAYLSPGRLVLVYPDNGAWSGWSEGTFWQFSSSTDIMGCLSDYSEATWKWDDDNGACWGNAGYGSFVYAGANSLSGNTWWGVPSTSLAEQISGLNYGLNDGDSQTMTFTDGGIITKSSGGKGGYTYDITKTGDIGGYNEGKTLGRLYTTGDGILFPARINGGGATADEFDIVHISDDNLVLAHPNKLASEGGASWEECTFWRFKKVVE